MKENPLRDLLCLLAGATPEQVQAILGFAARVCAATPSQGVGGSTSAQVMTEPMAQGAARRRTAFVLQWTGRDWKVVFSIDQPFYLEDTLGARYLDYLLHHPNEPISAFELEVAITPEKGGVRAKDSIQPETDSRALREYRRELQQLEKQREKARAAGRREEVERLNSEIKALEAALKGGREAADTGDRARSNVRLAIRAVAARLRKGGPAEKAFAAHLRTHLSLGYECLYTQPAGRIWE